MQTCVTLFEFYINSAFETKISVCESKVTHEDLNLHLILIKLILLYDTAADVVLQNEWECISMLLVGEGRKKFAKTEMNMRSSRAHTILTFNITQILQSKDSLQEDKVLKSQLCLVDLAGCEQLKQSKATGQRKNEAVEINLGLLALKKTISALSNKKDHIPYYESKLTMLLKTAFGGSCRTTAIVTCSEDSKFGEQTLHALRFGETISNISNKTRTHLTNKDVAIRAIDEALHRCNDSIESLVRQQEGQNNPSKMKRHDNLIKQLNALKLKRQQLANLSS